MSGTVAEIKSGLTLKSLTLGVALLIFLLILEQLYAAYLPGWLNGNGLVAITFWFMILGLLSMVIKAFRLTMQEWVLVYSMVLWGMCSTFQEIGLGYLAAGSFFGSVIGWTVNGLASFRARTAVYGLEGWNSVMPAYLWPTSEAAATNYLAKGPIPVGEWAVPILFHFVAFTSMYLTGIFIALIYRRYMLSIERLAFPMTTPALYMLDAIKGTPSEKPSLFNFQKHKPFWIGMVVGIIILIPEILHFSIAPGLTGFGSAPWYQTGFFHFTPDLKTEWDVTVFLTPSHLAIISFLSLDVLLTAWIYAFVATVVYPYVGFTIAGIPGSGWGYHYYYAKQYWGTTGFFKWRIWSDYAILGIALWAIIVGGKYLIGTLKAVMKPNPEIEKDEPLSYRTMWLGAIASGFIFLLTVNAYGIPIHLSIIFVVVLFLVFFGATRMRAETGYIMWWWGYDGPWIMNNIGLAAGLPHGVQSAQTYSAEMLGSLSWWYMGYPVGVSPGAGTIESLRIADITKTSQKDIVKAQFIAVPLGILVGLIFYLTLFYGWGGNNLINPWWRFAVYPPATVAGWVGSTQPMAWAWGGAWPLGPDANWDIINGAYPHIIISIAIVFGLYIARTLLPWFPLHPAGVLIGDTELWIFPSLAFAAWLIKYIVVRVGGAKLLEKANAWWLGLLMGCGVSGFILLMWRVGMGYLGMKLP